VAWQVFYLSLSPSFLSDEEALRQLRDALSQLLGAEEGEKKKKEDIMFG